MHSALKEIDINGTNCPKMALTLNSLLKTSPSLMLALTLLLGTKWKAHIPRTGVLKCNVTELH